MRQNNQAMDTKSSKKKKRGIPPIWILVFFIATIILCIIKLIFSIQALFWFGGTIFTSVFLVVINQLFTEARKYEDAQPPTLKHISSKDSAVYKGAKIYAQTTKKSPVFVFTLWLTSELLLSDITAAALPVEALIKCASNAIHSIVESKDAGSDSYTVIEPPASPLIELPPDTINIPEDNSKKQVLENSNKSNLTEISISSGKLRHMILLEPNRYKKISDAHKHKLFFQSGQYSIPEDASPQSASTVLLMFIKDQTDIQLPNNLSQHAPENIKSEISKASNSIIQNSDDLDKILYVYEAAHLDGYDNFDLTNLISNSYYDYGLAYFDQALQPYTTEYYLLMSIQWRFDSLVYSELTPERIARLLRSISQAYEDISIIPNLEIEDRERAALLSSSFELARQAFLQQQIPTLQNESRLLSD